MQRSCVRFSLAFFAGLAGFLSLCPIASAQQGSRMQWIWTSEGDPVRSAPTGMRFFRRAFKLERPADEGALDIAASDRFTVWLNGTLIGKGDDPRRVYHFDVRSNLIEGRNQVGVEVNHKANGPAGLLVRCAYVPNGFSKRALVSDGGWRAASSAAKDWQKPDFEEQGWKAVKVLGPYGEVRPWHNLTWDAGGDERFSVPPGFRVEVAVKPPASDSTFSLINMTFDAKGRLLISRESGPVLLCTRPDDKGVLQDVKPYCTQVRNCQGMCWVKDALLLVGNGPQGTGLYRCRDTKGTDKIDEVKLLLRFRGGMGEHGPHAILHGPDDMLYVVIGNHASPIVDKLADNSPLRRWPTGAMGLDQGKPNTTEDVLLPRLNDANGHAANILAPGGTIWRMDHDCKNISLVAAGFRNAYDAAFSPFGELFTFDSDMEWDENLPWYRAVRICHCPPGADFVWRTGAANTPDYYIDSLPPLKETGRGSPVGMEFYDHNVFPEKYRGALFLGDWSLGIIYAVHLERDGATYKGEIERFCTGAPMNVTDLNVGPDGAIYFVMGGRNSQGGVYRIAYSTKANGSAHQPEAPFAQPLSAWGRAQQAEFFSGLSEVVRKAATATLRQYATDRQTTTIERIRDLDSWSRVDRESLATFLPKLLADVNPEIRAQAALLLGMLGTHKDAPTLILGLKDNDGEVRRRACDALIRTGVEPPVERLWPLLGDPDRFVRHAARLVLERIDPKKWADRITKEANDLTAWNGIIALCQTNHAEPYAEQIFTRLRGLPSANGKDAQARLDYLRTVEMALIHVQQRPIWVEGIAEECAGLFPHADWRVNRELAILITEFRREGILRPHASDKVLDALLTANGDHQQQIHYFYCLRLLKEGWTPNQKAALAQWYNGTRTWQGGHSFTPFLANIFKDWLNAFTIEDRRNLLAHADQMPLPALVLADRLQFDRQPELVPDMDALLHRLPAGSGRINAATTNRRGPRTVFREADLRQAVEDALTKTVLAYPTPAAWPHLVDGLGSRNPLVRSDALAALRKLSDIKPKADDPAPYRTLLTAAPKLSSGKEKWTAVEVLRQWNGRSFGADPGDWKTELNLWSRWFGQAFPKEAPLPIMAGESAGQSKYQFADLLNYLTSDPHGKTGDPSRGRLIFEKASCVKCHKFGKEGEGVGPDLTTVAKRFKRADILESILYPSKAISDQYRSVTITTTKGQQLTGLAAVQGDTLTVLLSDTSRVTLNKTDIESQVASLVSVMPERLLDPLTRAEIADLFAYLESEPRQ
jgi:putative heme-binding domain-containing protein